MITQTIIGIVCVLAGLLIIAMHFAPAPPAPAAATPAQQRQQLAHSLGLGHRLGARLIRSGYSPPDRDLVAAAALYRLSPLQLSPARIEIAAPLLELEQLLERMDGFNARVRRWSARGPARGTR